MVEERLPRHPCIAARIIGWHKSLVPPEAVHLFPGNLVAQRLPGKDLVGAPGCLPPGEENAEPAVCPYRPGRLFRKEPCSGKAQGLQVRVNLYHPSSSYPSSWTVGLSQLCPSLAMRRSAPSGPQLPAG